ncbi:DNA-binding protein [Methylomonas sp. AM2-LC]|uniref:DNA-binding protein n=1 Tax=Methylomonas sp. AM2-LC TaxID=3153301 RepID=UPI0032630AE6
MSQLVTPILADVRERIIQAANDLYKQAGRQSFPTVDEVRRYARVDMNAASFIMREWRRAQSVQAAPVAVHIPDAMVKANHQMLVALWTQAQELANESLRTAQSAWDTERAELDEMRQELAYAYEAQAAEFDLLKSQAADAAIAHQEAAKLAADELAGIRTELAQSLTRAERAEAQVGEIDRRAADLRTELDRAHEEIYQARSALANQQKLTLSITAESNNTKSELTKALVAAEALVEAHQEQRSIATQELDNQKKQLDQAIQSAANAREHAAELVGKFLAMQEQNAALLARLGPNNDLTLR